MSAKDAASGPQSAPPEAALLARIQELELALERQTQRARAIEDIGAAMGSTLELEKLITLVMTEVTQLMDAERSTLYLVDEATGGLWSKFAQGSENVEIRLAPGEGLAGHVARTGETINAPDAYADPRFQPQWDQRTGFRTRSVLCAPVQSRRRGLLGVLQVLNKTQGPFTAEDEALLAAVAGQIAVSVENAKLYRSVLDRNAELASMHQQLERKNFELEFLYRTELEVAQLDVAASEGLDERARAIEASAVERVIERTAAALDAESGSVLLTGPSGRELYFKGVVGARAEALRRVRLSTDKGIAAWVTTTGEPVLSNDPSEDPRHHWALAEAIDVPARNLLCVPVRANDAVVGAFELLNKRSGGFTESDLKLLTLAAAIVSRVVQRAHDREAHERASRLADLGQMLSGIVHDFKTPMTIISGHAQLMVNEGSAEARAESCQAVLRQFDHMNQMTMELLAFARGESTVLFRRLYVARFIEELEELLRPEFAAHGTTLHVDIRYRGTTRADEGKLRRLVHNIARNALEAMPSGGRFTLEVDSADQELVLTFTDTGAGVPDELMPRIFDSFVTRGKPHGTGLGLAIAKKIVDEHRGRIEVRSAPSAGASFIVRLPLDPEAQGRAQGEGGRGAV